MHRRLGEINHNDVGRGVYFRTPTATTWKSSPGPMGAATAEAGESGRFLILVGASSCMWSLRSAYRYYPVTVSFSFLDISKAIRRNRTRGGNIKTS
jgi:hypothetical protein